MADTISLTVVQVAMQFGDMTLTMARPARHATILYVIDRMIGSAVSIAPEDQGFLLSDGTFAGRRRAYDVAYAAGQITKRREGGYDGPELFSEDVW